ncbi:MAG TPA: phosphoribosyltransferase family protein [Vicinamibacterales bacterium]|nr:phosphoribosyltransferase family protein [Vicinamibacterales bacterium]
MHFKNREEAAALLADRLQMYRGQHPLVLGVPRGAVPMARIIADALDGDLDVVLVRKLRAPGQPELALGAIDEAGRVLKGTYFDVASDDYIREEIRTQQEILRMRRRLYTAAREAVNPAGRIVIIVDDGIATGSSMLSAIGSVRARAPQKVVVAIGVAPTSTLRRLETVADEVVCLHAAVTFYAVGAFFDDFSEVTDDMVVESLRRTPLPHAAGPASPSRRPGH